ncbi:MAG: hypothetical protein ACK4RV_11725 [Caulobacter sp.]
MRAVLITAGIGAIACAVLGGALTLAQSRADRFEALDRAHRACVAAIGPNARADRRPEALCDPAIAGHWARSIQARACDEALAASPVNLHAARASCSAPVKRLQAEHGAAAADIADLTRQLAEERAGRRAAIDRASADAKTQAERKLRREAADARAPRDPAGRVICDADCLRDKRR